VTLLAVPSLVAVSCVLATSPAAVACGSATAAGAAATAGTFCGTAGFAARAELTSIGEPPSQVAPSPIVARTVKISKASNDFVNRFGMPPIKSCETVQRAPTLGGMREILETMARQACADVLQSWAMLKSVAGAQLTPAKLGDLRRLLGTLTADDIGALDASFADWLRRPLGRDALAGVVIPAAGSAYIALLNIEPAGLIVIERGEVGAQIRILAVAPDMRKRGLAQTMLARAETLATARGLRWLWMSIAHDNAIATRCALRSGYRRFRPQFLRRTLSRPLNLPRDAARVERLRVQDMLEEGTRWVSYELNTGDAWCAELGQADLLRFLAPHEGTLLRCIAQDRDIGAAHVYERARGHLHIDLWLEAGVWGTDLELSIFRAVLEHEQRVPDMIDLEFGSMAHLKESVELFRPLGFAPALHERIWFVKEITVPVTEEASDGDVVPSAGRRPEIQTED
jgi:ribosomal protein S18 acetylase RimI-like enzyme